jgi:2-polyprenyl-6-methoxyphenol hydroxylase-like FAD-dependent oxidoreductase
VHDVSDIVDVSIVGYGPVGQALAIALVQQGHSVVVIDRRLALHALPRAVGYDHEVARILQALGVAESLAPHTHTSSRYEWRNAAGQVLKAFHGLDQIALSGWPDKMCFCQPELEKILDARLRSFGSRVKVLQGWDVVSAAEHEHGVLLTARPVQFDGQSAQQIKARFVVGCDGASSFIRQAIGSRYEELGFTAEWLVVDIQPKDPADWNSELIQICDPARPTTLVSGGPGRRRLEFMILPGETREAMNTADVVWRLLARSGWTPENATLERHAVYTFRACIAKPWRLGRMLLAGDAAHLLPPFAAQGLCAGFRDSAALSWRLHHVLNGDAGETLLDSYCTERAHHVRVFIEFSVMLGRVICELDSAAAAARDAQLAGPEPKEAGADRYPDSRLTASNLLRRNDPHAGELSLQARVRCGDRVGLYDDLVGRGFVLMGLDQDPGADLQVQHRRFLERLGGRIVTIGAHAAVGDADGSYERWFAGLGCRAVLIRPDFYLFGAGDPGDLVQALQDSGTWDGALK